MFLASETIEILDKVHGFYNDAWTNLLWVVGVLIAVLGGVIGVLVPWWLERSRRHTFELSQKEVMDKIDESRNEYKQDLERSRDAIRVAAEETGKEIFVQVGRSFYGQLGTLVNQSETNVGVVLWFWQEAIDSAIRAGTGRGDFLGPLNVLELYFRQDHTRVNRAVEDEHLVPRLARTFRQLREMNIGEDAVQYVDKIVACFKAQDIEIPL